MADALVFVPCLIFGAVVYLTLSWKFVKEVLRNIDGR